VVGFFVAVFALVHFSITKYHKARVVYWTYTAIMIYNGGTDIRTMRKVASNGNKKDYP
jgi:hypothetical protein